ncbi:MAG: winged helix DNA-binding domain-containing protein [Bacillati bacterium ANGP1]|uniref:Winged helix DNA-binding domain-containing protein n=1 Tax=Candidatus Segetimicrobium genomatis TaxID=2569760 RepID=A0A537JKY1_9BACT|nr:MAG: winged helix DNA-binding domain-containing protein [Terrabacteria group bacterium ANGP1]
MRLLSVSTALPVRAIFRKAWLGGASGDRPSFRPHRYVIPARTSPNLSERAIRRLREQVLRHHRVRSKFDALRFIRAVGYCYAFTPGPGRLPSLFEVLDTRSDDRRWAWAWDWKEALPSEKRVFYGRILARKPTFISLAFLPHFFALTGNVGEPDDYSRLYEAGRLSALAKRVYETVAAGGPLTTRQIRAAVEPDRRGSSARLLRALAELQNLFLLARTGEVGDNPGNYAFVWDLLVRWLGPPRPRCLHSMCGSPGLRARRMRRRCSGGRRPCSPPRSTTSAGSPCSTWHAGPMARTGWCCERPWRASGGPAGGKVRR